MRADRCRFFFLPFCLAFAVSARSATFTVTTTNDIVAGSLWDAITKANKTTEKDDIRFQIPPLGPVTIRLGFALPSITNAVIIDGTTQTGAACPPGVTLDGSLLANFPSGLHVKADDCEIRGLIIDNFAGHGIYIDHGSRTVVEGNYIGVDATGSLDAGNGLNGIYVVSGEGNEIGSPPVAQCGTRNIISGNGLSGIRIEGHTSVSNLVRNNYIGTDVSGAFAIPNGEHGVYVENSSWSSIGDDVSMPHPVNVISGNASNGVYVTASAFSDVSILGNFIGTDRFGTNAVPNGTDGVLLDEVRQVLIGRGDQGGNVISGNGAHGIALVGSNNAGNVVKANLIGLGWAGTKAVGNAGHGVSMTAGVRRNILGGTNAADRNIISGNLAMGVSLSIDCDANQILGNFIGTDITGVSGITNHSMGILLNYGSDTNLVGVDVTGGGNIVAGNVGHGVVISGSSTGNRILNNLIGLNANNQALGNGGDGVRVTNADGNEIGGSASLSRNVISGNGGSGIQLGSGANFNGVYRNIIGLDTNGVAVRANAGEGIHIFQSQGNNIGRSALTSRNIISGNQGNGVKISSSSICSNNTVRHSLIGTDLAGANKLGNGDCGVYVLNGPHNLLQQNVISGNDSHGIQIEGASAVGNAMFSNKVGVVLVGTNALGNGGFGVYLLDAVDTMIGAGGIGATGRNVIAANGDDGLYINGAQNSRVMGNHIGTSDAGTEYLGNQGNGIWIGGSANGNVIGGTNIGEGNAVYNNQAIGVRVHTGTNNAILGNSIYRNFGLGIDIGGLTVTDNDEGDSDSGANNLQNFPVVFSAGQGSINVGGTLNSRPSTSYRLEFFLNDGPDFTEYGEGQTFLGFTNVTTDASGNIDFELGFAGTSTTDQFVSVTATDPWGNTSEFGLSKRIVTASEYDGDGDGIPSEWEDDHSLDPHSRTGDGGAGGDPDLDRMNNWNEYVADTNPQDSNDYQRFTALDVGTVATLEFSSTNSRYYVIHYADELESSSWTELYSPALKGWNNTNRTIRHDVSPGSMRAYRVQVQLQQ
ncbi:MAG: right-handed parallel beta-helix repeat-containing protein [Verrucomicrobia bacterium]|nr:right-handed parallel beta-helix repeat-containing protein [Verrucomicrobiota bacterium]